MDGSVKTKNKDGEEVILTSTGTKLQNVGMLTIGADGALSATLLNASAMTFINSAALITEDNGAGEALKATLAATEELREKVVAQTDVDLVVNDPVSDTRIVRSQETNLGDLVADAYRIVSNADIGFINGGGVRKIIKAGNITFGNMLEVHPFGNEVCVIEANGQQVLDALEWSVHLLPGEFGGFLQVSGLKFTIDMNVDSSAEQDADEMFIKVAGDRRVKDVQVLQADGTYAPLDPEKTYTVAGVSYFLTDKGNGYTMFEGSTTFSVSSWPGWCCWASP